MGLAGAEAARPQLAIVDDDAQYAPVLNEVLGLFIAQNLAHAGVERALDAFVLVAGLGLVPRGEIGQFRIDEAEFPQQGAVVIERFQYTMSVLNGSGPRHQSPAASRPPGLRTR